MPFYPKPNSGGGTDTTARYASAATRSRTQPLLAKLQRGQDNATILVVSDSTANETTEWAYLSLVALAARFPAYTLVYNLINDGTGLYTATTVQTGTGAQTLTVWNCAIPSTAPAWIMGSKWDTYIAAVPDPDLMFMNHGHNLSFGSTAAAVQSFRATVVAFTELLTAQFPGSPLVIMSQNPVGTVGRETWSAQKGQIYQALAAEKGYGFIDVERAFQDQSPGHALAGVRTDALHPTTSADSTAFDAGAAFFNGSQLWADTITASLYYDPKGGVTAQVRSAMLDSSPTLIANGDFSSWDSTNPDNWTATNVTLAKDTTNFDTGTYGMKVTAGATDGLAYAQTTLDTSTIKGYVTGKHITVTAWVFIPAGQTVTPQVIVRDQTSSTNQMNTTVSSATTTGRFYPLVVTKRMVGTVASPTTTLTIQIYAKSSGVTTPNFTVDRVDVVVGDMPRRASTGGVGTTGATGSTGQGVPTGGTSGQALTKIDGTDYNTHWSTVSGTATPVDVQVFTTSGTWTKPAGAVFVHVLAIGGGGGGGSGRRGAAGTNRAGGGGGGGGARNEERIIASGVGSTETVTIGAGGNAGAAITADSTNGANGSTGGASTFGTKVTGRGGLLGLGGQTSAFNGVAGGIGLFSGGAGGGNTVGTGAAAATSAGGVGGGSGGAVTSADSASAGGASATASDRYSYSALTGGAVNTDATAGTDRTAPDYGGGDGGPGGGASIVGAAGAGAAGKLWGGGGGGGGAALNGNNSGAGGAGAAGLVIVTTYF